MICHIVIHKIDLYNITYIVKIKDLVVTYNELHLNIYDLHIVMDIKALNLYLYVYKNFLYYL